MSIAVRDWPAPVRSPPRADRRAGAAAAQETPRCASTTSPVEPVRRAAGRFDTTTDPRRSPRRARYASLSALATSTRSTSAPAPTSTARPRATAGPPGTAPSTARSRGRTGWSPTHGAVDTELGVLKTGKEADVHLAGTRRARHRPRDPAGGQALPHAPSTACSTATPATWRAAGSGGPGRPGPWPTAPRSAATCSPGSGRSPSSLRCAGCGRRRRGALPGAVLGHRAADGVPRRAGRHGRAAAGPAASGRRTSWATCGTSSSTRCSGAGRPRARPRRPVRLQPAGAPTAGWSLIDLPQVVDVVGNPQGPEFLARDVRRVGEWFAARGLPAGGRRTRRTCSPSCASGPGRDRRRGAHEGPGATMVAGARPLESAGHERLGPIGRSSAHPQYPGRAPHPGSSSRVSAAASRPPALRATCHVPEVRS